MLIGTWNINSIRAREQRFLSLLARHQPDVLCLQELKVEDTKFPGLAVREAGYHAAVLGQKTYNGVAIVSRVAPKAVHYGLGDKTLDAQSRLLRCDFDTRALFPDLVHVTFDTVSFLSAYFPNGSEIGSDKWDFKLKWMKALRSYLDAQFSPDDAVLLMGDFNVAPFDDDISDEKFRNTVLACNEVRDALKEIEAFGFTDVVRPYFPEGKLFTWWDYRARGFERDKGLRIDHIWASETLKASVYGARTDRKERQPLAVMPSASNKKKSAAKGEPAGAAGPSDHAPLFADFDLYPRM